MRIPEVTYVPVILSLLMLSCTRQEQKPIDLVTFPLKGEVVGIDTVKHRLTVSHEEIPNYMEAMTMPFKVKSLTLLRSVHIGDSIQAVLAVSRTESWLDTFTVVGRGDAPDLTLTEGTILARMFEEGETLPHVELTNQEGKNIYISNFKGKVIALTFIYTRCPLPDFCIRMTSYFSRIQKKLSADKSLDGKWHLLSISFDPKVDSPAVLKKYGRGYDADFRSWEFVTADKASLSTLTDGFGLSVADDEGGLLQHTLRTAILDKDGKIVKIIKGNEWTPDEVVGEIKKLTTE